MYKFFTTKSFSNNFGFKSFEGFCHFERDKKTILLGLAYHRGPIGVDKWVKLNPKKLVKVRFRT